jgi:tetratricopeptide (TPR) repeat protein
MNLNGNQITRIDMKNSKILPDEQYQYNVALPIAIIVLPLIALLLVFKVVPSKPVTDNSGNKPKEWKKVVNEWECFWREKKTKNCTPSKIETTSCKSWQPFGDTWFMRNPNKFPLIDEKIQRRFVTSAISQNLKQRQTILEPLTNSSQKPIIRYRAYLEIARSIMRDNQTNSLVKSLPAIKKALDIPLTDERIKTDAYFFMGHYYFKQAKFSKALQILEKSIKLDSCFYEVRSTYIDALLKYITTTPQAIRTNSECLKTILKLLKNLQWIGSKLATDKTLYIELANKLKQFPQENSLTYHFALGFVQRQANNAAEAQLNLKKALNLSSKLPVKCVNKVREEAEKQLLLLTQQSNKKL